ncbi:MAG TPA: glycosyltransferase family 87 protein [Ktedonobacteraceae bacterium]|nr:glycosyltransferase family 87 protein [Ktedonobacteraceae bacterium]
MMDSRTTAHPAWLTSRRLRAHGLILALCFWCAYAWNLSSPGLLDRHHNVKGTDFLHFYTLGSLAREHRGAQLYAMEAQATLTQERVPQVRRVRFVPLYGPQVSLFFAPLSMLPYSQALLLWLVLNAAIYALCCYVVWKTCPNLQSESMLVFILALAYPGFFHLLAWGQSSGLALACFTAAYLALRSQRFFLAGLALGCLVFKPQLGLASAFVILGAGEWTIVLGALLAAMAQLSVGWLYYGTPVMRDYFYHLVHVRSVFSQLEPRPYQMHSLRSFWAMLIPWPHLAFAVYVITAVAALGIALYCWRARAPLNLRFGALLIATVLVSPHLTVYDLVILVPAYLLLADWVVADGRPSPRNLGMLLYLGYALPLLGPLSIWTHLQLSVPARAGILWMIFRIAETRAEAISEPLAAKL